jgi:UDP:flavonoid glycosyltransferase YjiC (YdhE family)
MMPLARAFLARGDEVLWATPEQACGRLEDAGVPARPAGRPGHHPADLVRLHPDAAALPPAERPNVLFPLMFGFERSQAMLADLLPLVEEWRPKVVNRDAAEFAAPIAAARHDVPCLTHAFGALLPEHRAVAAAASVAPLWEEVGLEPRPYGGSYDALYLDIYPPSLQDQHRPHVPATRHVRPTSPRDLVPAPERLREASAAAPLVYVTFGTVFNAPDAVREAVAGVRDLDVRVLVTVGPDGDPAALGGQPSNVEVARFVPQDDVLPHAALVVSHAGSGTFLGAAAAGVPQLCLPQGADQHLNAEACVRAGIGLSLPTGSSAAEVRDTCVRLLTEPGFGDAARRVSRDIAAMAPPADIADELGAQFG